MHDRVEEGPRLSVEMLTHSVLAAFSGLRMRSRLAVRKERLVYKPAAPRPWHLSTGGIPMPESPGFVSLELMPGIFIGVPTTAHGRTGLRVCAHWKPKCTVR